MDDLYQIYLITNTVNNKKYIGQTLQRRGYLFRFNEHLMENDITSSPRLHSAIKRYKKENFIVELVEDNILESEIDEKEQYYIEKYNTFYKNNMGYNLTYGGQGVHGYKHDTETKKKISEASKKYWDNLRKSPDKLVERNSKISKKLSGVAKSDAARSKLSISTKKRFQNSAGTFKGKKHSDETRKKISDKAYKIPVQMFDKNTNELLRTFKSISDATKFLIAEDLTKNKNAISRIETVCNKIPGQGLIAYGYKWEYLK